MSYMGSFATENLATFDSRVRIQWKFLQTIGLDLNFLNPVSKLNFQNLFESYDCSFIKLQMQIWTFYMLSTLLNSILSLPIWQMGKPVFRVKVFIKKLFSTFKYTFEFNKPLRSVWYYFHKNLIFHSWVTSVEVVFLVAWSYLSREIYISLYQNKIGEDMLECIGGPCKMCHRFF